MLYQHRIFVYMTGWGSLRVFKNYGGNHQMANNYTLLRKGFILYWFVVPTLIVASLLLAGNTAQSALSFLFLIYIQPLCAMSCFLGFINVALHGFLEFKKDGAHIPCINSITIIDGQDDSFGEDDHMAHHYYMSVEHVDLQRHHNARPEPHKAGPVLARHEPKADDEQHRIERRGESRIDEHVVAVQQALGG